MPRLQALTLNTPISSPQIIRILGLSDVAACSGVIKSSNKTETSKFLFRNKKNAPELFINFPYNYLIIWEINKTQVNHSEWLFFCYLEVKIQGF
jgi:hypothetical protein